MIRNDGPGGASSIDMQIPFSYPNEDFGAHVVPLPWFKHGETGAQKATATVSEAQEPFTRMSPDMVSALPSAISCLS